MERNEQHESAKKMIVKSQVLREDFSNKSRRLEELVAEARARQLGNSSIPNSTDDAAAKQAAETEYLGKMKTLLKQLYDLSSSYKEEVQTEINRLQNEFTMVETARQKRKIDMLKTVG